MTALPRRPKRFHPATRGDLGKALDKPGQLMKVSPESPRPAEMLEGVVITGKDALTADDAALHELLVTSAYGSDSMMSSTVYSMEVPKAMRFLGTDHRESLRKSLRRLSETTVSYGSLSNRRYEDVQLLVSWLESSNGEDLVRYQLPEPICILMRDQVRYAYVELAALSTFRCKYSARLYRILALSAARKRWSPADSNKITISATPEELADWIGFPRRKDGTLAYGKLKERFLSFLMPEMNEGKSDFDAVRRFHVAVKELRKQGRGREVTRIDFELTLRSPSHHLVRAPFSQKRGRRIGGADDETYRVNSPVWRKAEEQFRTRLGMLHQELFAFWQLAIEEALSGDFLTGGYHTGKFRGERLLDACRVHGADYAAWGFLSEEAESPDLRSYQRENRSESFKKVKQAAKARFERIGTNPGVVPPFQEKRDSVAVEEPKPSSKDAAGAIKEVVFPVDRQFGYDWVKSKIVPHIKSAIQCADISVDVSVRYWDEDGTRKERVGAFFFDNESMRMLDETIGRFLESEPEVVG